MNKLRISIILPAVALLGALSMSAQADTFSYTGVVTTATGAFLTLTPPGSTLSGDIDVADAAVAGGSAATGDITDIGVQLAPPGADGFCFTWGAGSCPAGTVVPISSIDGSTMTFDVSGASTGGTLDVTGFSPTFMIDIPVSFDFDTGTFSADGGALGTVDGTGDLSPTAVPPLPATTGDPNAIPTMSAYGLMATVIGLYLIAWRRLRKLGFSRHS